MNTNGSASMPSDALAHFTTRVAVITARGAGGRRVGVTANSFTPLSADPPLVLWSLPRSASGMPAFEAATQWVVHELAHDQAELAARFAGADPFDGVADSDGTASPPLLEGCAARFHCRNVHCYDGGDHAIMVGEILYSERGDMPPLIHHDRGYAIATSTDGQALAPSESPTAGSIGFLLGSAYFHIFSQLREACGKLGFNNIEVFVLMALGERGWRSRREIATLLSNSGQPTNLQALDDLEARSLLVAREGAGGTLDEVTFALTPTGWAAFAQCNEVSLQIQHDMEATLGVAGSSALRALLRGFVRHTKVDPAATWL